MSSRIALVTGGSRGIGLAVAEALGNDGFAVAIAARDRGGLDAALARLRAAGTAEALAIPADLRDPDAPDRVLDEVEAKLGRPSLLVNNAGTAPTAKFERSADELLDEVLDLHVRAPFRLIRRVLPWFRADDAGCIVQIGSSAGLRGFAFTAAYTAAKHAMVGMTRALAVELHGTRIGCYVVCPGFVDTEITRSAAAMVAAKGKRTIDEAIAAMGQLNRIGRMHDPAEVAAAVVDVCTKRPAGVVLDLDADPPAFV